MIYNYNPLKTLFTNIVTLIVSCLIGFSMISSAQAATLEQQQQILNEGKQLCSIYLVKCEASVVDVEGAGAFTTAKNQIFITKGLANIMNEDEFRAVVFHEVGHAVLRHSQRQASLIARASVAGKLNRKDWIAMRHSHELEADRFASYTLKVLNKPNNLDTALTKLMGTQNLDLKSDTHPTLRTRLIEIGKIKGTI